MGKQTKGGGVAAAIGGGGDTRRSLNTKNIKSGDILYIQDPNKRNVTARRKTVRKKVAAGKAVSIDEVLGASGKRVRVVGKTKDGQGIKIRIPAASQDLLKRFQPLKQIKGKRVREITVHHSELKGARLLRKGRVYKTKTPKKK